MELNKILTSLCYYDKRNPDCDMDDEEIENHNKQIQREMKKSGRNIGCYCDNCYYSRTELAEEILRLMKI